MMLLKFSNDQLSPALEEPLIEVTLSEWQSNAHAPVSGMALLIANDQPILEITEDINGFGVIVLEFPAFSDGRAYGQARLLRERLGYRGEIRARGNVLRDQIYFMTRCGFDAFEVDSQNVEGLNLAMAEFSFTYQTAADRQAPVWRQRTIRAAAA